VLKSFCVPDSASIDENLQLRKTAVIGAVISVVIGIVSGVVLGLLSDAYRQLTLDGCQTDWMNKVLDLFSRSVQIYSKQELKLQKKLQKETSFSLRKAVQSGFFPAESCAERV